MPNTSEIPADVATAMPALTGVVMRHGPDADTETFVAMATRLGEGMWATVADTGVYGGRVYDQFTGTHELIDLWIHPLGGEPMPVQWGHMSIVRPIAILFVPADAETPRTPRVFAPEMADCEYRDIWRHSFGGAMVFADRGFDVTAPTVPIKGCIYELPTATRYSYDHDRTAPCVRANMDHPGRKDVGGPVLAGDGRLAGIMIAPDYGSGSDHAGYYVPMDYIDPSVAMSAICRRRGSGGRHSLDVDRVSHRSHDVEFA